MFEIMGDTGFLVLAGFGGGALLGLAARLGRFCTLGAIEDAVYGGDLARARMFLGAIGCAIALTALLTLAGWFDPSLSFYHLMPFNPLFAICGGLLFGVGMAMAGNCGFGALARLGGGDLRSFVIVVVMGISAYVVLSGPIAPLRVALFSATAIPVPTQGIAETATAATGLPPGLIALLIGVTVALVTLPGLPLSTIAWATSVGIAVASGFAASYLVATEGFAPATVVSHSFTAPVGETILYIMTASGGGLSFGVGSVAGVLTGALVGSWRKGHFRWEACEDPRELRRQILGAASMGLGAVMAGGCSIGQGISGMATLAWSAPLTLLAIVIGARLGLRWLIEGRLAPG